MREIDGIAAYIGEKQKQWERARGDKERNWERYYRTWRCIESDDDKTRASERSKIKTPATKNAIDTAHDHIMATSFARDPFFELMGRQFEDELKAQLLQSYLEYLFHKERFQSKYSLFVREMLIYGTAVARVKVNIATEKSYAYDGDIFIDEISVNRPHFDNISIFNFFINPTAKSVQEAEGCIVRSYNRLENLYRLQANGIISGVDELKSQTTPTQIDDAWKRRLMMVGISPDTSDRDYETHEWWGWIPEDVLKKAGWKYEIKNGGAEVFAISANGVTLKAVPNPFWTQERPFVSDRYEAVPDEFYGMGICEITEGSQRALDATVRSRMDNKALAINTIFGINVKKLVAGQSLDLHAGKKLLVEGDIREAIQQFKIDDVTSGSYHESAEYERYIQEGSGVSKFLGGMPQKRGEMTATETSALAAQQSVRIRAVMMSLEENVIKEVLRWYYQIILQFLDVPELIKVSTKEGDEAMLWITPEDIMGDYDFIPQGLITLGTVDKLGKTMQILGMTANPFDAQTVDRPFLIRKVYEMLGFNDSDKVFTGVSQLQAVQGAMNLPNVGTAPTPNNPQVMLPQAQGMGGMIEQ